MAKLIQLQSTIFILIFCGFFFKKKGFIGREGQKNITDLVVYLFLPCATLNSFLTEIDGNAFQMCLQMFIMAALLQFIMLIYGKLLSRRMSSDRAVSFCYATIVSNASFLGYPMAEGMFGAAGLMLTSVYLIPSNIMMWSAGLALFAGVQDIRTVFRKVALHPCVIACMAGLVLMITGWTPPELLLAPLSTLARCNTAMSMLVIGMILADTNLRMLYDRDVLFFSLQRLVLIPLMVWIICKFLPLELLVEKILVLIIAMPAAATTTMLAAKYEREPGFAVSLVVCSTLLALPTLFLWGLILQ